MSWDYSISGRALKQLKGELNNIWRYRSGNYRILCQLQDDVFIVLVLEAGHRKDIYK
ncbi:type II toxin-antitoxin system RelE/ParE family toxin [Cerasicoccus arenae]|uniref:type II toxin-antitoxin system RelE family toxin n=1 Tax=Cerasicoccus arenae TaxID=424488 RepID=UPI0035ED4E85